ncbi:MAG: DMT family transporter [Promethearchaeota archaeon]
MKNTSIGFLFYLTFPKLMKNACKHSFTSSSWVRFLSIGLLVLTTLLWGTTFIITKNVVSQVPVFFYISVRFIFASAVLVPIIIFRLKRINKSLIQAGIMNGVIYFLSLSTQTIGLQTTTAGKAGFITGLNALIVPFLMWIGFKKPVKKKIWASVLISMVGMLLLMIDEVSGFVIGDVFEIFCAFFCAIYIILVDYHINVKQHDVYAYCWLQIVFVFLVSSLAMVIINENITIKDLALPFWLIMIYLGAIVTALTFLFQNIAQVHVEPSKTAIIFALEPVFALLFASFLIGNEKLTLQGLIGCGLIFIAILLAVIKNNNMEDIEFREELEVNNIAEQNK